MSTRTVTICTAGECGGECYRCRLTTTHKEKELYRSAVKALLNREHIRGGFGPWSDQYTDSWQWLSEQAEDAEELSADFAPGPSQHAIAQAEYAKRKADGL